MHTYRTARKGNLHTGKITKRENLIISREELASLLEYSLSIPTGTIIGKRWRKDIHILDPRRQKAEWIIGEYYELPEGDTEFGESQVGIRWYWAVDENHNIHMGAL